LAEMQAILKSKTSQATRGTREDEDASRDQDSSRGQLHHHPAFTHEDCLGAAQCRGKACFYFDREMLSLAAHATMFLFGTSGGSLLEHGCKMGTNISRYTLRGGDGWSKGSCWVEHPSPCLRFK
jgi:hypothetical protein